MVQLQKPKDVCMRQKPTKVILHDSRDVIYRNLDTLYTSITGLRAADPHINLCEPWNVCNEIAQCCTIDAVCVAQGSLINGHLLYDHMNRLFACGTRVFLLLNYGAE